MSSETMIDSIVKAAENGDITVRDAVRIAYASALDATYRQLLSEVVSMSNMDLSSNGSHMLTRICGSKTEFISVDDVIGSKKGE